MLLTIMHPSLWSLWCRLLMSVPSILRRFNSLSRTSFLSLLESFEDLISASLQSIKLFAEFHAARMFATTSSVTALWLRLGREEFTHTLPILVLRVIFEHLGHFLPFHNDRLEFWMCSRPVAFEDLLRLRCNFIGGGADVPFDTSDNCRFRHVRRSNDCDIADLITMNKKPPFSMKRRMGWPENFDLDIRQE